VSRGDRLLERMRRTKHGWRPADLQAAYRSAGFLYFANSKHDGYYHPRYSQLRTTVTRSDPVKADYITVLISLIDQLEMLEAGNADDTATPDAGV
jgi:hypothetical protein